MLHGFLKVLSVSISSALSGVGVNGVGNGVS